MAACNFPSRVKGFILSQLLEMCQVYGRGSQGYLDGFLSHFSLTETQADSGMEVHSIQWNLSILFFSLGKREQQKEDKL